MPNKIARKIVKWLHSSPVAYGYQVEFWHLNHLLDKIQKTFHKTFEKRTLTRELKRLGFSYRKLRPVPPNTATPEVQDEFKGKTSETIKMYRQEGRKVIVLDEAGVMRDQGPQYGWHPANANAVIKVCQSKKTVKLFGALGENAYHIKTAKSLNSDTFIEFLRDLLAIYPKLIIVMDNAAYHKSKKVNNFVESTNGALMFIFLPKYTPQLNPIETQWAVLKRLLGGKYFATLEDLEEGIMALVNSGEMKPVKMHAYLTP